MSIYKGGYILADLSDKDLNDENLLSKDLQVYLLKYYVDGGFIREVLSKPISLICTPTNGGAIRITMNMLSDDFTILYGPFIDTANKKFYRIEIYLGVEGFVVTEELVGAFNEAQN